MLLNPNRTASRCLCHLLAVLMLVGPTAPRLFAAEPVDATYVAPNPIAAVLVRPQQILKSDLAQLYPVEVLSAASLKEAGFDVLDIKSVLVTVGPLMGEQPEVAATIELSAALDLSRLEPKLLEMSAPTMLYGKTYYKSKNPKDPCIYQPRPDQVVIATERTMQRFLQEGYKPLQKGQVHEWLATGPADDFAALADLQMLRPLIQMGVAGAALEVPPEYHKFLDVPALLSRIEARLNVSGAGPVELVVDANDETDAVRVEELIDDAFELYEAQVAAMAEELLASDDPVEQAMGRYQLRVAPAMAENFRPQREGSRFTLFTTEGMSDNPRANQLMAIATVGILVALLLPAVQAAREAARRTKSMNNMKQLMLGLLYHHDTRGAFPAHANYSEDGKPLLSWRVHVLPFLEQQALYDKFHLDEPWDSPHNKQLIPLMPEVLLDPSSGLQTTDGKTSYLGVSGAAALFNGTDRGTKLIEIRDGTAHTLALVQVSDGRAAVWTKPDDWQFNTKKPLDGLDGPHPGGFLAARVDGSVLLVPGDTPPNVLRAMTTISGGEVIDID